MVAARQAVAGNVQLAGHANGSRLQFAVEDVQLGVGDGLAEQCSGALVDLPGRRPDGGFGGAVEVPKSLGLRGELVRELGGQRLAAAEEAATIQAREVLMAAEQRPGARRRLDHRHALLQCHAQQARRVAGDVAVYQHHAAADQQRQVQLQRGNIEGQRGQREHAVPRIQARFAGHAEHEVDHPAVAHRDALGLAGGAGGVDDVGEIVRASEVVQIAVGVAFQLCPVAVQAERAGAGLRQLAEQVLLGQQQAHVAVVEHVRQAFGGEFRVQRHVGAAGLEHGEQSHRQFDGALQRHADAAVRADTLLTQPVREAIGAAVQLGVAEAALAIGQRDVVRRAWRLLLDQLVQAGIARILDVGGVPAVEQLFTLAAIEQRQARDRAMRIGDDTAQQVEEMPAEA